MNLLLFCWLESSVSVTLCVCINRITVIKWSFHRKTDTFDSMFDLILVEMCSFFIRL